MAAKVIQDNFSKIQVAKLKDLEHFKDTTNKEGDRAFVAAYSATGGAPYGSGSFVWKASQLKNTHNGGSIIDPDMCALWDGTIETAAHTNFMTRVSQPNPTGYGVWMRDKPNGTESLQWYGSYPGLANSTRSLAGLALVTATTVIIDHDITYTGVAGATIFSFSGQGVNFQAGNAVITDNQTYSGTQANYFIKATNCVPVNINIEKHSSMNGADTAGNAYDYGVVMFQGLQGCRDITINAKMQGGLQCVVFTRASSDDPQTHDCRNIVANIKCNNTHYPYTAQFSGSNAHVNLDVEACGRNIFVYGVDNVTANVVSKNQQVTSLIKCYEGIPTTNIKLRSKDVNSTLCQSAAPHLAVEFGDQTAGRINNVDIQLDLVNPTANPFSYGLLFAKYDNANNPDSAGRGHIFENINVSGRIDSSGPGVATIGTTGSFIASDVQSGINFRDLVLLGGSATITMGNLVAGCICENVYSASSFYITNSGSAVTFLNCVAANFTGSTSSANAHNYIGCKITDGSAQNYTTNKNFIDTSLPTTADKLNYLVSSGSGAYNRKTSKLLSGDLTGTNNIFFMNFQSGGFIRLAYYLIADSGDTNPATRDETAGIKYFSITQNSSGALVQQLPIAAMVTEATMGTASVPTFALVSGTSAGAHISVSCTNYSGANARGIFELEFLGEDKTAYVVPA